MRLGEIRLDLQSPAVACHGVIELPKAAQGNAQIVVCFGIIGVDQERPGVVFDRQIKIVLYLDIAIQVDAMNWIS